MCTNEEVQKERETIRLNDEFAPHDLELHEVEKLRNALIEKGCVERAYVAMKRLEFSADFPFYVVLVKLRARTGRKRKALVQDLAESGLMPWDAFIVPVFRRNRELEYKLAGIPAARIL